MDAWILAVGFGEPPEPDEGDVIRYLEQIFLDNMEIEGDLPESAARERASELAKRRTPGLIAEYEAIGGSPMQAHLAGHADRLAAALDQRGHEATVSIATQYFEPTIDAAVGEAAAAGAEQLVVLPMYPLCGPSTTVAAIASVASAVDGVAGWDPTLSPIGGWHRHPRYNRLRADNIRRFVDDRELDLHDDGVELVFSAHGTPIHYLEGGSRYDRYVEEYCDAQARLLGVEDYTLGYQNHEARGVEWTEPDIETAIERIEAEAVVLEPVSFIHEQSETVSELDIELAEEAAEAGLAFHRVPVPHDDPELADVFADLVEPAIAGFDDDYYGFRACQCATTPGTRCLCAPRL